jgi:hypothetical protein
MAASIVFQRINKPRDGIVTPIIITGAVKRTNLKKGDPRGPGSDFMPPGIPMPEGAR